MPKIYLLKKSNPDDPIWKHYPEEDFVRWGGENEEEARRNAARGSLPRSKPMSLSPWLNRSKFPASLSTIRTRMVKLELMTEITLRS